MDKTTLDFVDEALERLDSIELNILDMGNVLEMEGGPIETDQINQVFRDLHVIKASAAAVGEKEISTFVHEIEALFDLIRKNKLEFTTHVVEMVLFGADLLANMIRNDEIDEDFRDKLIDSYKDLTSNPSDAPIHTPQPRSYVQMDEEPEMKAMISLNADQNNLVMKEVSHLELQISPSDAHSGSDYIPPLTLTFENQRGIKIKGVRRSPLMKKRTFKGPVTEEEKTLRRKIKREMRDIKNSWSKKLVRIHSLCQMIQSIENNTNIYLDLKSYEEAKENLRKLTALKDHLENSIQ